MLERLQIIPTHIIASLDSQEPPPVPKGKKRSGRLTGIGGTVASLLLVACNSSGATPPPNSEGSFTPKPTTSGDVLGANTGPHLKLDFPFQGTWYFTSGPHIYTEEIGAITDKIRPELDFAPSEVVSCKNNANAVLDNEWVTASESGKVILVQAPGMVTVEDANGFDVTYEHIKVKGGLTKDKNVATGDKLGNPGCFGNTTGIHVDISVSKAGQSLPAENLIFSGFEVRELPKNYDGLLVNGNDIRTANQGRFGPGVRADGLRNDVSNNLIPSEAPTPNPEAMLDQYFNEEGKSTQDQARIEILKHWLSAFHQNAKNDLGGFMITNASNLQTWVSAEIPTILNGGKSSTPLTTNWLTGGLSADPRDSTKARAEKFQGELELNNVSIREVYEIPLSDEQKANDIQWIGIFSLDYIERYHANEYTTPFDVFTSIANANAWAHSANDNPFPDFSSWEPGNYGLVLTLMKDGTWQINAQHEVVINGKLSPNADPRTMTTGCNATGACTSPEDAFAGLIAPSDYADPTQPLCPRFPGYPCQVIKVTSPYK